MRLVPTSAALLSVFRPRPRLPHLLFWACLSSAGAVSAATESTLTSAQTEFARGDFANASIDYESVARSAAAAFASDYWLLAADSAVRAGSGARAEQMVSHINLSALDDHQRTRLNLIRAQAAMLRGHADAALGTLPASSDDEALADAILQTRGEALFRTGDLAGAVSALVQRETRLTTPAAIQANRATLWSYVSATSPSGTAMAGATDAITRGWLELGQLAHHQASLAELDAWRKRYPKHPGQDYLAQLMMPADPAPAPTPAIATAPTHAPAVANTPPILPAAPPAAVTAAAATVDAPSNAALNTDPAPENSPTPASSEPAPSSAAPETTTLSPAAVDAGFVALLLPQSGTLAAAGAMVQEGFGSQLPSRVYDTGGSAASAVEAYHRAMADGANLVVGPLVKDAATAIANSGVSLPIVTLNYLDTPNPPTGLWQFGLSPEDEATAAADDALAHGLRRVVILSAAGDWGERIAAAFHARFSASGGIVLQTDTYPNGTNDFGPILRRLLKLDAAEYRHKAVDNALGIHSEFTPQPRSDIDFVFLAARAAQARLIVPQLHFYRAQELPIYATSSAFDGGTGPDLAGLRVCDVPVLGEGKADAATPVDKARLNALGHDAGLIALAISNGTLGRSSNDSLSLDGQTGHLTLAPNASIRRQLSCSVIAEGGLKNIP